jgi:hypothetical protein
MRKKDLNRMKMMNIIKEEDFAGEHKKCDYVLAYFQTHDLHVGDLWSPLEYMQWIQEKHEAFHQIHQLSEDVTYWKDHNEELQKEFVKFLEQEPDAV